MADDRHSVHSATISGPHAHESRDESNANATSLAAAPESSAAPQTMAMMMIGSTAATGDGAAAAGLHALQKQIRRGGRHERSRAARKLKVSALLYGLSARSNSNSSSSAYSSDDFASRSGAGGASVGASSPLLRCYDVATNLPSMRPNSRRTHTREGGQRAGDCTFTASPPSPTRPGAEAGALGAMENMRRSEPCTAPRGPLSNRGEPARQGERVAAEENTRRTSAPSSPVPARKASEHAYASRGRVAAQRAAAESAAERKIGGRRAPPPLSRNALTTADARRHSGPPTSAANGPNSRPQSPLFSRSLIAAASAAMAAAAPPQADVDREPAAADSGSSSSSSGSGSGGSSASAFESPRVPRAPWMFASAAAPLPELHTHVRPQAQMAPPAFAKGWARGHLWARQPGRSSASGPNSPASTTSAKLNSSASASPPSPSSSSSSSSTAAVSRAAAAVMEIAADIYGAENRQRCDHGEDDIGNDNDGEAMRPNSASNSEGSALQRRIQRFLDHNNQKYQFWRPSGGVATAAVQAAADDDDDGNDVEELQAQQRLLQEMSWSTPGVEAPFVALGSCISSCAAAQPYLSEPIDSSARLSGSLQGAADALTPTSTQEMWWWAAPIVSPRPAPSIAPISPAAALSRSACVELDGPPSTPGAARNDCYHWVCATYPQAPGASMPCTADVRGESASLPAESDSARDSLSSLDAIMGTAPVNAAAAAERGHRRERPHSKHGADKHTPRLTVGTTNGALRAVEAELHAVVFAPLVADFLSAPAPSAAAECASHLILSVLSPVPTAAAATDAADDDDDDDGAPAPPRPSTGQPGAADGNGRVTDEHAELSPQMFWRECMQSCGVVPSLLDELFHAASSPLSLSLSCEEAVCWQCTRGLITVSVTLVDSGAGAAVRWDLLPRGGAAEMAEMADLPLEAGATSEVQRPVRSAHDVLELLRHATRRLDAAPPASPHLSLRLTLRRYLRYEEKSGLPCILGADVRSDRAVGSQGNDDGRPVARVDSVPAPRRSVLYRTLTLSAAAPSPATPSLDDVRPPSPLVPLPSEAVPCGRVAVLLLARADQAACTGDAAAAAAAVAVRQQFSSLAGCHSGSPAAHALPLCLAEEERSDEPHGPSGATSAERGAVKRKRQHSAAPVEHNSSSNDATQQSRGDGSAHSSARATATPLSPEHSSARERTRAGSRGPSRWPTPLEETGGVSSICGPSAHGAAAAQRSRGGCVAATLLPLSACNSSSVSGSVSEAVPPSLAWVTESAAQLLVATAFSAASAEKSDFSASATGYVYPFQAQGSGGDVRCSSSSAAD